MPKKALSPNVKDSLKKLLDPYPDLERLQNLMGSQFGQDPPLSIRVCVKLLTSIQTNIQTNLLGEGNKCMGINFVYIQCSLNI